MKTETLTATAATTAPAATPETSAPASTESSRDAATQSQTAANGQGEGTAESTTEPTWRDALKSADRDEVLKEILESTDSDKLVKQPKLAGLLGDLAEKRARAKEAEIEKKITERLERERLKRLRDEDPYAYAQEEKRREDEASQAAQSQEANDRTLVAWAGEINTEIAELARTLPKSAVEKLAGKKYEGSLAQGLRAYVTDVIDASKEAWLADAQQQWKKELLPALRKEALAEVNGGESSSPDTTQGTAPAGALTQAEWARNGRDRAWRQANRSRIEEALRASRIRPLT